MISPIRLLIGMLLTAAIAFSQSSKNLPVQSSTGQFSRTYHILNINNITTWLRSDGQSNHSPTGDNGVYYPRGTGWVVYQDGILWVGKAYRDSAYTQPAATQLIRSGGQMHNIGTQPGWVTGLGTNAFAVNPDDPRARIYRIRRDFRIMTPDQLRRDAAESLEKLSSDVTAGEMANILSKYERDWNEWPADLGAPYIERNGIPGYQPPPAGISPDSLITGFHDEPGVAGGALNAPADQVMWVVCNDLNPQISGNLAGSNPLGLEMQITMWGYNQSGPLGQTYFKRIRLINKGGVDTGGGTRGAFWIDSMFVSQWVDHDIGSFGNDLVGCDPLLSLGYGYNSVATESPFRNFGIAPPAIGYALLAGPVVAGTSSDSAIWNFRRVHGKKNLPQSSFGFFSAGGPSQPPFGYEVTLRNWRALQGFVGESSTSPWRLYPHPPGVEPTKFPLSGDPVARTGFIDGQSTVYSPPPGDRRIYTNTGPFRLAPGDTQEVVLATMGGLGADHLSGVTAVKFNARAAHAATQSLFGVAGGPFSPLVKATALDGLIILDWGSDTTRIRLIEEYPYSGGHRFEGYAVYQLPATSNRIEDGTLIATSDRINNVARIVDEVFDPVSGLVIPSVLFYGSDSGVRRHLQITKDALNNNAPLRNGREYRFAVVAYTYSSHAQAFRKALASDPAIITMKPQIPFGAQPATQYADTLPVRHTSGRSEGTVQAVVVDPLRGTGDTFEIRFDTSGGSVKWDLLNTTRNTTILAGQRNLSGDDKYPIVEGGIQIRVTGVPRGIKRDDEYSTDDTTKHGWRMMAGSRYVTYASADGLALEGFRGAAGAQSPYGMFGPGVGQPEPVPAENLRRVHIHFANVQNTSGTFNPTANHVSYAYRYGRAFNQAPARPEFAPYIINSSGGYAFQDYLRSMPLAVYDMDATPPRRLAVGFLENNVSQGSVDGRYWPPSSGVANNVSATGPREWLFIFDRPYTDPTPDPSLQRDILNNPLHVMYLVTWARRGDVVWSEGEIMALIPYRSLTVNDVYRYVVPAPDRSIAAQRASAEKAGVFPNPYYADGARGLAYQGRFVTFNNLPAKATIRILNLAGQVVRTLSKDDPSQFLEWDLKNADGWLVASGMYLCYIEMPEVGVTKVLKLAVVQEVLIPVVK